MMRYPPTREGRRLSPQHNLNMFGEPLLSMLSFALLSESVGFGFDKHRSALFGATRLGGWGWRK